jgi:prepilin-type N-terminal cleavage/methylation domain-containing protein
VKRRGLTLIELLVALALTVGVAVSLAVIFRSAVDFSLRGTETIDQRQVAQDQVNEIEQLVEGAYLTPDATDTKAYFVAQSLAGVTGGPDTLTWTTVGVRINGRATLTNTNSTFEDLNSSIGPQGGLAEVSLSVQPVGGDATGNGLFLRVQRPADGDITQGGRERLLIPDVTSVNFEFWNGTNWVTEWDTRQGDRRLPSLVRITLGTQENATARVLTIPVRSSDVTTQSPSTQGGSSA